MACVRQANAVQHTPCHENTQKGMRVFSATHHVTAATQPNHTQIAFLMHGAVCISCMYADAT